MIEAIEAAGQDLKFCVLSDKKMNTPGSFITMYRKDIHKTNAIVRCSFV